MDGIPNHPLDHCSIETFKAFFGDPPFLCCPKTLPSLPSLSHPAYRVEFQKRHHPKGRSQCAGGRSAGELRLKKAFKTMINS